MPDVEGHALTEWLTEDALILRLKSNEHDFVERKPLKADRGHDAPLKVQTMR